MIDNIYSKILELSDVKLQIKIWLNRNNDTGLISSYTEVMCSLFDDFNFDDFIDKTAPEIGISTSVVVELDKLRNLLNDYKKKESDRDIISDPEWGKIVEQAKMVIKRWNRQL